MSNDQKTTLFVWAKFIVGTLLFVGLVGVHVFFKDLPPWLIAMPAVLWGVQKLGWPGGGK